MKIKSVRIQNFRSFVDETIYFDNYTCLVGPNGAGKSNVFCALNVFFRNTTHSATDLIKLEKEDFHLGNIQKPIRITVTFSDLTEEAQEDFANYYRQGELTVTAEAYFNEIDENAPVIQHGQRIGMTEFVPFFEADGNGAKVVELKEIFSKIKEGFPQLGSASTKTAMIEALHEYETNNLDNCQLIPSADEFYGFSKGVNRLAKHIQWVFIPAVKDAHAESEEGKNTALGDLLSRTVRSKVNFDENIKTLKKDVQDKYQELLDSNQGILKDISSSLKARLTEWAHPDVSLELRWKHDSEKSIKIDEPFAHIIAGESGFSGNLSRLGHGLQRSYFIALLQELASCDDENQPRLILACEEPELYQHPPQARHLSEVLQRLSTQNSQVMVCTHSPYFISGQGFENVRILRKAIPEFNYTTVKSVTFSEVAEKISTAKQKEHIMSSDGMMVKLHQSLQPSLNEIFFAPKIVLVEGLEDVAYIQTYLHLMGRWDDYRRLGCHIVPANKKSYMLEPLAMAKKLDIPIFLIFDSDGDAKEEHKSIHENDNLALLRLAEAEFKEAFPSNNVLTKNLAIWKTSMGNEVDNDFAADDLMKYKQLAKNKCGHVSGVKDSIYISHKLNFAWQDGKKSQTLESLCTSILKFAEQ